MPLLNLKEDSGPYSQVSQLGRNVACFSPLTAYIVLTVSKGKALPQKGGLSGGLGLSLNLKFIDGKLYDQKVTASLRSQHWDYTRYIIVLVVSFYVGLKLKFLAVTLPSYYFAL